MTQISFVTLQDDMLCNMENSSQEENAWVSNVYIGDAMHDACQDFKSINESLPKVSVYTMIQF